MHETIFSLLIFLIAFCRTLSLINNVLLGSLLRIAFVKNNAFVRLYLYWGEAEKR